MKLKDKKKVLLVNKDPNFLDVVKLNLEKEKSNFDITTTRSLAKSLKILNEKQFCAVVSDYSLIKNNSFKFLEKVRDIDIDIPTILFIDDNKGNTVAKVLEKGYDRVVMKNYNVLFTTEILNEVLKKEIKHYQKKKTLKNYWKRFGGMKMR